MAADRRALRVLGLAYGGLTAAVALTAFLMVVQHVQTGGAIDAAVAMVK